MTLTAWQNIKTDKGCAAASIMGCQYRIYEATAKSFWVYRNSGRGWDYLCCHHSLALAKCFAERHALL
tara:strand:+ start:5878 stop:6081 length:204 start_codon:yes stop_codon:yes gene_type:complete